MEQEKTVMDEPVEALPEEDRVPEQLPEETPGEGYVPRPRWQVAAAWVGLAVFLFILVLYYGLMFGGNG